MQDVCGRWRIFKFPIGCLRNGLTVPNGPCSVYPSHGTQSQGYCYERLMKFMRHSSEFRDVGMCAERTMSVIVNKYIQNDRITWTLK